MFDPNVSLDAQQPVASLEPGGLGAQPDPARDAPSGGNGLEVLAAVFLTLILLLVVRVAEELEVGVELLVGVEDDVPEVPTPTPRSYFP
jgi:hypothetical protein